MQCPFIKELWLYSWTCGVMGTIERDSLWDTIERDTMPWNQMKCLRDWCLVWDSRRASNDQLDNKTSNNKTRHVYTERNKTQHLLPPFCHSNKLFVIYGYDVSYTAFKRTNHPVTQSSFLTQNKWHSNSSNFESFS